jgi:hypothetical protein
MTPLLLVQHKPGLLLLLLLLLLVLYLLLLLLLLWHYVQAIHQGFTHCHVKPCWCVVQQLLPRLHPRTVWVEREQRVQRQQRGRQHSVLLQRHLLLLLLRP